MTAPQGLYLIDGGRLFDEPSLGSVNRVVFYEDTWIPSFGLVLPGLESRLSATGYLYSANMSREVTTGLLSVFQDRSVSFTARGAITNITGDETPVLVLDWVSGDFAIPGWYKMQMRAAQVGDTTRVEKFPVVTIEILSKL